MAKKFEYKWLLEKDVSNIQKPFEKLDQLGQEGWELVGINPGDSGSSRLYFKREIESPLTHKQERNGYEMSR